eukprot:2242515-Amphidinium_carterae.1
MSSKPKTNKGHGCKVQHSAIGCASSTRFGVPTIMFEGTAIALPTKAIAHNITLAKVGHDRMTSTTSRVVFKCNMEI